MARIKKILCPVDFFAASERALDFAIQIARIHQSKLTVLHVVSPIVPGAYEIPMDAENLIQSMISASGDAMKALAAKASNNSVSVECMTRLGYADDEIHRYVVSDTPDLLVMGTHGRRGVPRWFIGSTTERMLRRLHVPILIVGEADRKEAEPLSVRRILVASDLSAGTAATIAYAASFGTEDKSKVILLHCLNEIAGELSGKYREPLVRGIREELQELTPSAVSSRHVVEPRVQFGVPADTLLRTIESENIDLVALNVHDKDPMERIQSGTTIERVVRASACPVLIVPTWSR